MKNDDSRHRLLEFAGTANRRGISSTASKLDEFPSDEIVTTIITYEEQMRGWMSFLAKMCSIDKQVFAYKTLKQYFDYFKTLTIIDFDQNAAEIYKNFKSNKIRIGSIDNPKKLFLTLLSY